MKGAQEVKDHPWFKNYPWKDVYEKRLQPKYIPKSGDNFDQKYCQAPDKIGTNTKENYQNMIMRETLQELFRKFTYIAEEEKKNFQSFSYKSNSKKFINPHMNLSSSIDSTRLTNRHTNDKSLPSIFQNRLFKNKQLSSSQSSPNIVIRVMKNSNSMLNYNYIKKKPISGLSSYYFQN